MELWCLQESMGVVEVPFKMLPAIQKRLIDKCYKAGKDCLFTATQMLDVNAKPILDLLVQR